MEHTKFAQDSEGREAAGYDVQSCGFALTMACHAAAVASGWWGTPDGRIKDPRDEPNCFPTKLMLCVSELAESMEGDRKNLPDDKLPQYPMRAVELADNIIRSFDLGGAYGYDMGEIIAAKLAYNAQRSDHKPENRLAAGGKVY